MIVQNQIEFPINWNLARFGLSPQSPIFAERLSELGQQLTSLQTQLKHATDSGSLLEELQSESFRQKYLGAITQLTDIAAVVECYSAENPTSRQIRHAEAEVARLKSFRDKVDNLLQSGLHAISPSQLQALADKDPDFSQLLPFFLYQQQLRRLKLSTEQEDLLSEIDLDGLHAWGRLYDALSGELKISVMEKGEIVTKSPGQINFDHPDRSLRANNFYASEIAWKTIQTPCAAALNHIAGARLTRYRRAGLQDHLEVPLTISRIQRQTLDSMWSAITSKKACLVDFLKRKQQLLGLESLAWYDILAPLPGPDQTQKLTYNHACHMIENAFRQFSPDLGDFAHTCYVDQWIEAENRPGKRQGGFCTTIPGHQVSRIFMTYLDSVDTASTLAHELGHAYHSYVMRDLPTVLQDYPMTLAETASTFAEAIMGNALYQASESPHQKIKILNHLLQDSVAFLMNIHSRFIFEDRFYSARQHGELSPEQISDLMVQAQREAYCNTLSDESYNPTFWISKLHFYITGYPFYNFPYTFGYLLSLGLFHAGQNDPEFAERLRKFLYLSGQMSCEQAVQTALGEDITQPDFWLKCIEVIEDRVAQFLNLTESA